MCDACSAAEKLCRREKKTFRPCWQWPKLSCTNTSPSAVRMSDTVHAQNERQCRTQHTRTRTHKSNAFHGDHSAPVYSQLEHGDEGMNGDAHVVHSVSADTGNTLASPVKLRSRSRCRKTKTVCTHTNSLYGPNIGANARDSVGQPSGMCALLLRTVQGVHIRYPEDQCPSRVLGVRVAAVVGNVNVVGRHHGTVAPHLCAQVGHLQCIRPQQSDLRTVAPPLDQTR